MYQSVPSFRRVYALDVPTGNEDINIGRKSGAYAIASTRCPLPLPISSRNDNDTLPGADGLTLNYAASAARVLPIFATPAVDTRQTSLNKFAMSTALLAFHAGYAILAAISSLANEAPNSS
jgi:hypothetical protein